jgi:thiamine-monophosphate kinase
VGRHSHTVNLSDVAAMGGIGRYATVSLLLPPEITLGWVDALYDGLLERAAEAGVALIGGNLARSREGIVVDVTMLGDAGAGVAFVARDPGNGFTVHLTGPATDDVDFTYFIADPT